MVGGGGCPFHRPGPLLRSSPFLPFLIVSLLAVLAGLSSCSWFRSAAPPRVGSQDRLRVAVLSFGMGIDITSLSSVQSLATELAPDKERTLVAQAVEGIKDKARYLLYYKLAVGQQFDLVPLEQVDRAQEQAGLKPGEVATSDQLAALRTSLGADLLVGGIVQDFGKVRWQWLVAGMAGDMTWESVVIGLATSWNPAAIFGNIGFELLTSTPVWFGGGYLFGVAFSPVRVDAWAQDAETGRELWTGEEITLYLWKELEGLAEEDRKKKEIRLWLNLKKAVEGLGESLLGEGFTLPDLRERRRPLTPDVNAFDGVGKQPYARA